MLILNKVLFRYATLFVGRVRNGYVSEIVVSDAFATQKRAFIYKSPLTWWKKGLGEGESPRVGTSAPPPSQPNVFLRSIEV